MESRREFSNESCMPGLLYGPASAQGTSADCSSCLILSEVRPTELAVWDLGSDPAAVQVSRTGFAAGFAAANDSYIGAIGVSQLAQGPRGGSRENQEYQRLQKGFLARIQVVSYPIQ